MQRTRRSVGIVFGITGVCGVCVVLLGAIRAWAAGSTITAAEDTYVRSGSPNNAQGDNIIMIIREPENRILVRFSEAEIDAVLNGNILNSATLRLFVELNNDQWGTGKAVNCHRLTASWAEGTSGSDMGATWNTRIQPSTTWSAPGGDFVGTATDTISIADGVTGWIEFDVTSDVAAFYAGTNNYGWIVRKDNESLVGKVEVTTKDSTNTTKPQLLINFSVPTATATATVTSTVTPTPTVTPTLTATPQHAFCPDTPRSGCRPDGKAVLVVKNKGGAKDKLVWKWLKGFTDTAGDFGDPSTSTSYALCVYDEDQGGTTLRMTIEVPTSGFWSAVSDKGFKYKDKTGTNAGIRKILMKAKPNSKAKLIVKGKGSGLGVPSLPLVDSATNIDTLVQFANNLDPPVCWEAVFTAPAKKNTGLLFKDKDPQ